MNNFLADIHVYNHYSINLCYFFRVKGILLGFREEEGEEEEANTL